MSSDVNDLREMFPDLEPIRKAPSIGRYNGIGTAIYGKRDYHEETGTYVKTLCFVVLFIPLLALRSYRVLPNGDGFSVLGREPISSLARAWNALFVCLVLAGVGVGWYQHHTNTPEYKRRVALAAADEALGQSDLLAAQESLLVISRLSGKTAHSTSTLADRILDSLMDEEPNVFLERYADLERTRSCANDGQIEKLQGHIFRLGQAASDDLVLQFYMLIDKEIPPPLEGDDSWQEQRQSLLEKAYRVHPQNPHIASAWAVGLEEQEKWDACEKVLAPIADQLGNTEGARILGTLYAQQGAFEKAYKVLWPYAEQRLTKYHILEKEWSNEYERLYQNEIDRLNRGGASQSWYVAYDKANEQEQMTMVDEWIYPRINKNSSLRKMREKLERSSDIVGLAFDLGIISLYHGQACEGEERIEAFTHAETAFLSIQGTMGDSQEYQLYLAKVYGWMNKREECENILSGIAGADAAPMVLAEVSSVYRELGNRQRARELLEQAYERADGEEKFAIAGARSLLFTDLDDQLLWLERNEIESLQQTASLAYCRGQIAYRDGLYEEAEKELRLAVQSYEDLPENSSTLNNGALAANALFLLSGSIEDLQRGVRMQKTSLRLMPNHSIVVGNTIEALMSDAVLQLVGDSVPYAELKSSPSAGDLTMCCQTESELRTLRQELVQHESMVEAIKLSRRLVVLSPSSTDGYQSIYNTAQLTSDMELLQYLAKQVKDAQFDMAEIEVLARDSWQSHGDPETIQQLHTRIARIEQRRAQASADVLPILATHDALLRIGLDVAGEPVNCSPLIETLQTLPQSVYTQRALTLAHETNFYHHLRKSGAIPREFQKIYGMIDTSLLVALAIDRHASAQQFMLHPSAQHILSGMEKRRTSDPEASTIEEWLWCRKTDQERARQCVLHRQNAASHDLSYQITDTLNPWSLSQSVYRMCDYLQCGKSVQAQQTYENSIAKGMPINGIILDLE